MSERIETLHPTGKQGVNIDRGKYEAVKTAILTSLSAHKSLTFKELNAEVGRQLEGNFDGSVSWYFTTVKLDLEARGMIERFGRSPQQYRLIVDE